MKMAALLRPRYSLPLLAVAALAAFLLLRHPGTADTARYRTETVDRGDITQTVSANGTLNPVTLVSVGTQVSGTVKKLYTDFNDHVKEGQVLLVLDDALLKAALTQDEANLKAAESAQRVADSNRDRVRELAKEGFVSQQEMDTAEQGSQDAQAKVTQLRAAVDKDRANIGYSVIRSPVSGVVVSRSVDEGQTVAASFNTPELFKIAKDLREMQIDAYFAEADVGQVKVGMPVSFRVDAFPNERFNGVVKQIRLSPKTDSNVVTYDVVIGVSNPDERLLPGMTAYVDVSVASRQDVLRLPNAALRFHPEQAAGKAAGGDAATAQRSKKKAAGTTVYVPGADGTPQAVQVKTGVADRRFTEILSGPLREGVHGGGGRPQGHGGKETRPRHADENVMDDASAPIIEITDLVKEYASGAGPVRILHGISLTIRRGEFVAVMGPSGSGKSTFMNMLGCLDVPTSGRYLLNDRDVGHLGGDALAAIRNRDIGFVFQGFNLLPRASLGDNVALPMIYAGGGKAARRARAQELLDRVGLGDRTTAMPSQISGGQQQRVAIARALVNRPALVLADEPTGNLDTHTSHDIMELFSRLNREEGITLIVVTHENDVARFADRLVRLVDGRIDYDGPMRDWLERHDEARP
jgi:HlyD family secretion protein